MLAVMHFSLMGQTSGNLPTTTEFCLKNETGKNAFFQLSTRAPVAFMEPGNKQIHLERLNNSSDKLKSYMNTDKNNFFMENRRNRYSSLWAFTSLNYLYADLAGLMDKNVLSQYQEGIVGGMEITPAFLSAAALLMQIPISNVFLPQVIKNERTLKWVQVASGIVMTLVQSGTLFMGKPAPYYVVFSVIEIGVTGYITIDALKWKPKKAKPHPEE